jgi:hypothetical protein
MVVEGLELDFNIRSLHDFVYFAILLATDEFTVFVCKLNLESDLMVEGLQSISEMKEEATNVRISYLNHLELHYHVDSRPNFLLEAVHFETHAFEHHFRPRSDRDLFEEIRHLRGIQRRRGQQGVELDRQEPK